MPLPFLAQLLIGLVITFVGFLLMPRPKVERPANLQDLEAPTADAGRPIPVLFGTMRVKGVNVLWFGDVSREDTEVS